MSNTNIKKKRLKHNEKNLLAIQGATGCLHLSNDSRQWNLKRFYNFWSKKEFSSTSFKSLHLCFAFSWIYELHKKEKPQQCM